LQLFFGEASEAEARVYARVTSDAPLEGWRIGGSLLGPECQFAKTLTATIPFVDRGPGNGLLAEAIVPDPCFWTPELPFLYRAKVVVYSSRSVVRQASTVDRVEPIAAAPGLPCGSAPPTQDVITAERDEYTIDRAFGIRRLGVIGRSLYLDGKRWVARGVCQDQATEADLLAARDAGAALLLSSADDAICEAASRLGVPLVVHVDASLQNATPDSRRDPSTCSAQLMAEVRRLAQWPAVFAIVLDSRTSLNGETRAAARNTLLAIELTPEQPVIPAWAQLAVAPVSPDGSIPSLNSVTVPIIAVRRLPQAESITAARAACDSLQFELAPSGDFPGYFV
jgi:hypothetical protein